MITVADYVAVAAATTPERLAVISVPEKRSITYGDLSRGARAIAAACVAHGLQPGDRVACWMPTSLAYIETYFALASAGLVIVPINERFRVAEAAHIVSDAGVRALFHGSTLTDAVAELGLGGDVWTVAVDGVAGPAATTLDDLRQATPSTARTRLPDDAPFAISYTSGTSGTPKGAVITHRSMVATNRANAVAYRLPVRGTVIYGASMSFTGTVLGQLLSHFYTGSTVVVTGTSEPEAIVRAARDHAAGFIAMPPPLIAAFTDACLSARTSLPSLGSFLQSGGTVPKTVLAQLNELLSGRLILAWGMTEISGGAGAATTLADMTAALAGDDAILESVGRPVPGVLVQAVSSATDSADADVRELRLRTDGLMAGYWNRPEETDRVVRDGWYYSGDLGTVSTDGVVRVVDRRTDLIVSGGANVYPSEVERVVLELPAVHECAVVGLPSDRWGQTVVAVVVPQPGSSLGLEDVVEHCRKRMAGYKKPSAVYFAHELPHTVSGKLQRHRVRDRVRAGEYAEAMSSGRIT